MRWKERAFVYFLFWCLLQCSLPWHLSPIQMGPSTSERRENLLNSVNSALWWVSIMPLCLHILCQLSAEQPKMQENNFRNPWQAEKWTSLESSHQDRKSITFIKGIKQTSMMSQFSFLWMSLTLHFSGLTLFSSQKGH